MQKILIFLILIISNQVCSIEPSQELLHSNHLSHYEIENNHPCLNFKQKISNKKFVKMKIQEQINNLIKMGSVSIDDFDNSEFSLKL